jgi:hypothetical protein
MRRRLKVGIGSGIAAAILAVGMSAPSPAAAAKPCGKRSLDNGSRPRVAVRATTCDHGVEILNALYAQIEAGTKPDHRFRWHVTGYRCYTGLGSTEVWCHSGRSWVLSSTRPDDHPERWPIRERNRGHYWRHCGSQNHPGAGWYHVRAHDLHCGKARAVARHYFHSLNPDAAPFGFSCHSRQTGYELANAACRREIGSRVQKVRFIYGA